jgi:hypothetical protein
MSFDALTISGMLAALVSTGFVVGVVRNNGRAGRAGGDAGTAIRRAASRQRRAD